MYNCDGRLIRQYKDESKIIEPQTFIFYYDFEGVAAFKYTDKNNNDMLFFYQKDAQGNIIAIVDSTGSVVVQYWYDAWGNHKVVYENGDEITDQNNIGNLNPFRYRGYYYDTETGLYFLQTRYYDPEVGRFLNRDSVQYAAPETINGLNLYAYCLNNPVEYVDPDGTLISSFIDVFSALTEIGIGGGLSIVAWAYKTGVRPKNIGIGTYNQFVNSGLTKITKASNVLSKLSTGAAILSVGASVIEDLYHDIQKGYGFGRTLSNTVTNIAIYGGTTFGIGAIGGKIGSLVGTILPGLGNVVGAAIGFALGIGVSLLMEIQVNGKSIIEHIRDGIYNFWVWLFGE